MWSKESATLSNLYWNIKLESMFCYCYDQKLRTSVVIAFKFAFVPHKLRLLAKLTNTRISNWYVRFEVLMMRKMMFFWVMILCRLIGRYQCFREIYCLHFQGWSPICFTETMVSTYEPIRHHNPEEHRWKLIV
jgi:hypothetical protein